MNLEESLEYHGIDANDADPRRKCPVCVKIDREQKWQVIKAMPQLLDDGVTETTFLILCDSPECVCTLLLRRSGPKKNKAEAIE